MMTQNSTEVSNRCNILGWGISTTPTDFRLQKVLCVVALLLSRCHLTMGKDIWHKPGGRHYLNGSKWVAEKRAENCCSRHVSV